MNVFFGTSLHFHFYLFLKVDDVEWLMHVKLLKYYEVLAGEEVWSLAGRRAHRMLTVGLRIACLLQACASSCIMLLVKSQRRFMAKAHAPNPDQSGTINFNME